MAHALQFFLHARQEGDVLLHREPADESEHMVAIVARAVAFRGMKEFGIDAARHQAAGAIGESLQLPAEFGIGSKQELRLAVERGRGAQGQVFDGVARRLRPRHRGSRRRNQLERRAAYSCTLVCQLAASGRLKFPCQARAQHAHFAGTGDVNQVGPEALQHFIDDGDVAQKGGIVAKILFERERKSAARQFEGPDIAIFDESLGAIAGADTQKGQVAPAREGLKVAAGVGDSVHFVEGVGKVGNARRRRNHGWRAEEAG